MPLGLWLFAILLVLGATFVAFPAKVRDSRRYVIDYKLPLVVIRPFGLVLLAV